MAMRDLDTVLADWREEAAVLRKHGQDAMADSVEKLCGEIAISTEEFRTFVPESAAMIRTNKTAKWLRSRFREWESAGHARFRAGHREYRLMILPQRGNPSAAYEAGRRDGAAA
jgi:hypothetical protein